MAKARPNPFGCFDRRYLIEILPAIAAIAASLVMKFSLPRTPDRHLLLVGISSVAVAWAFIVTVAAIRRLDELQQRIQLIAIAVAFAATGVLLAVMSFFQAAGFPAPKAVYGCTFMMVAWAVSIMLLSRRYR